MYYIAHLVIEAGVAVLMLCAVFAIIIAIKRAVAPKPSGTDGVSVVTVIMAAGRAAGLEQTVYTLGQSRAAGEAIIIIDCGMSCEAKRLAEILARADNACLYAPEELPALLEDCGWTHSRENTFA